MGFRKKLNPIKATRYPRAGLAILLVVFINFALIESSQAAQKLGVNRFNMSIAAGALYSNVSNLPSSQIEGKLDLGGTAGISFDMNPGNFGLEMGFFYKLRKYKLDSDSHLERIGQIDALIRLYPSSHFSIGLGPFYALTLENDLTAAKAKSGELGVTINPRLNINLFPKVGPFQMGLLIEGRASRALVSFSTSDPTAFLDFSALVGLRFGMI